MATKVGDGKAGAAESGGERRATVDVTLLIAGLAIAATISGGTCTTFGRFDDIQGRFNDVSAQIRALQKSQNDNARTIGGLQGRFDDVSAQIRALQQSQNDDARTIGGLMEFRNSMDNVQREPGPGSRE